MAVKIKSYFQSVIKYIEETQMCRAQLYMDTFYKGSK